MASIYCIVTHIRPHPSAMTTYEHGIMDDIEHARTKAFMTGSFERTGKVFMLDAPSVSASKTSQEHSPALQKIIDEPLTNISDAHLKTGRVRDIAVTIDEKGFITVYNSGSGVPVDRREDAPMIDGRVVYTPEMVFSMLRAGSNLRTDKTHSVGGVNGLGVKLTAIHSDVFIVETVDPEKRVLFIQQYTDGLSKRSEPSISRADRVYTRLSFLPTYSRFGYSFPDEVALRELIGIVRLRLYHLSVFLHEAGSRVLISLNGEAIPSMDVGSLLGVAAGPSISPFSVEARDQRDTRTFLKYAVAVYPRGSTRSKMGDTSIVNGCVVKGGAHFDHLLSRICARIREMGKQQEMKDIKKADLKPYMTIAACARLCVDNWGTQNKDKLELPKEALIPFALDEKVISAISAEIMRCMKVTASTQAPKLVKVERKVIYDKYTPPRNMRGDISLLLAEGDSAKSLLDKLLTAKGARYSHDNVGIFSLGGVPSNVAKMIEEERDASGALISTSVEDKFFETKCFSALVEILKLKIGTVYSSTAYLPYKRVIICTDADIDGRGCICSLVLQLFFRLWPCLFEMGFIQIWLSPVMRVYKGSKVIAEFKDERSFQKYMIEQSSCSSNSKIDARYFKGLATHGDGAARAMGLRFHEDLVKVECDDETRDRFETYYSSNSGGRKEELQKPTAHLTDEELSIMYDEHVISCNRHLDTQTKDFMLYSLKRTIPSLDSMTPVRRKVITVMMRGGDDSKEGKVFQIAGEVAKKMHYHHGDASLHSAITKMAQYYPGSNLYPLLIAKGQVGSRNKKGKDAGSPRYVDVLLNSALCSVLFPSREGGLLVKKYEEDKEVEPEFYMPVLPLAILETRQAVSYGWSHRVYARDIVAVSSLVSKMLDGLPISEAEKEIPLHRGEYKAPLSVRRENGRSVVHASGLYERKSPYLILISEIPLFISPCKYVEVLATKREKYIKDIRNRSTDRSIEIEVEVHSVETVISDFSKDGEKTDKEALDAFLYIHQTYVESFNFINEQGTLQMFDSAFDVLAKCVTMVKSKYHRLVEREVYALQFVVAREREIIDFMEMASVDASLIASVLMKPLHEAENALSDRGFNQFNNPVLNSYSKYDKEELGLLLGENLSFDHILNIRVRDLIQDKLEKRKEKLAKLEDELDRMMKADAETPKGKSLYVADLSAAVSLCRESRWMSIIDGAS